MEPSSTPRESRPRSIPFWLAVVLFAVVWGVIPWAVSLLSARLGWSAGRPGAWNLLGLIPSGVGLAGSMWTLWLHFAQTRRGIDMEPVKNYLLTGGAYAYSRNPMYLAELVLLFGWVIFYGSLPVLILFLIWAAFFNFIQVPMEERSIEQRFGETYREYQRRVPRWIGKPGI